MAVLGPVEVRRDGVRVPVPGGKTAELLVRLALEAGVRVRTERLIDDLWSDQPSGVGRNTLQSKASRLRRALGDPALVSGDTSGYALNLDPGAVDALEVLRLAAAARSAADRAAVLAMFGTEVLPTPGSAAWVVPYRARLEETRLAVTEEHLADRLERGAAGELVGELQSLVSEHPLDERLWRLLILALYRADRQADALTAYHRIKNLLADELGLDPAPELRALERQILQQDASLEPQALPVRVPSPEAGPGNLPGLSDSLLGRATEVAAVDALLQAHRLVTVVGPAGVGKTRLAVEIARAHPAPDGRWMARLENTRGPAPVWLSVGEAFELAGATEAMILDRLRGQDLLLVLDNCEHLIETLPDLVDRMLAALPGLRLLATSQLPLGLDGEVAYALEPLAIADSVALFRTRATRQRRSFDQDADADRVVEQVCLALDGLPLAIELAAARVKALSLAEIARRLGDRFTLLNDPTSQRPPRQRTLRAALAWSYDLLFPDDQRGLWALACFSGGAPLAAAEHVLGALGVPEASALDVVGRLVDRSLVSVDIRPDGAVRYRLLDSVRAFSLDRLAEADLVDTARAAHTAWFAAAASHAEQGVRGPEQAEHLALVRSDRANIDDALGWAATHDPIRGLRIANGFGWAWVVIGAGVDGASRVREALAAAGGLASARDRVTGLLLAGWLEASAGNLDRATRHVANGRAIAELELPDTELSAVAQLHLAFVHSQQGRAPEALAVLAGCRTEFQRRGLPWEEGASWVLTAWAEIALGHTDDAQVSCDAALTLIEPLGDAWGRIHAEAMLGRLAQAERRFDDAVGHLGRAAEAASQLGFGAAEAHHLTNLGHAQYELGTPRAAIVTLERALEVARAAGDLRSASLARIHLARAHRTVGETAAARALAEAARAWYAAAGGGDGAELAEVLIAELDAETGESG